MPTDGFGIAERADIKHALDQTGGTWDSTYFQTMGVANYKEEHKFDQLHREGCRPGTMCFMRWMAGSTSASDLRYANIFEMNGLETLEHGVSTGVRGGNCNSPPQNDPCNGQYPCEALFQKYYADHANSDGRIYKQQLKEIICHAQAEGDRSGEWSYHDDLTAGEFSIGIRSMPARQWQMTAAMYGWLSAFGREDEDRELYLTISDARAMMMENRVPDDWEPRPWGCILERNCPTMPDGNPDIVAGHVPFLLPCDMDEPWWKGTGLVVATGAHCRTDSQCNARALCISQRCICDKGRNGVQMLYEKGQCVEQPSRLYMGETCRYVRANSPSHPSVWDVTWQEGGGHVPT